MTWTGTARRLQAALPNTDVNITISDLGGNATAYSLIPAEFSTDNVGTELTAFTFAEGIRPFYIYNSFDAQGGRDVEGFISPNVPLAISFKANFADSVETLEPTVNSADDVLTLDWTDENGVLTMNYAGMSGSFALFATQFFASGVEAGVVPLTGTEFLVDRANINIDSTTRVFLSLTDYQRGRVVFDIMSPNGYEDHESILLKLDHSDNCICEVDIFTTSNVTPAEEKGVWQTISVPISALNGLRLGDIKTGIVFWPNHSTQLDGPAFTIMLRDIRIEATIPSTTEITSCVVGQ